MNKIALFLVLFVIVLAAIGYYMNADRSEISFENSGSIADEGNPTGEDPAKEIPDFINEQIDSFS